MPLDEFAAMPEWAGVAIGVFALVVFGCAVIATDIRAAVRRSRQAGSPSAHPDAGTVVVRRVEGVP